VSLIKTFNVHSIFSGNRDINDEFKTVIIISIFNLLSTVVTVYTT
jgi:hypothetical protein